MMKIAPAFVAAKKAFGPALKDKTNPAFRSRYADLGACLEAVDDALLENGIAVYHETTEDPKGITIECVLLHTSGEVIRGGKLHVPATKHDAQGFGSAMSYARRYSLMAVCGIAPEDDDGNAAVEAQRKRQAAQEAVQRSAWIEEARYKLEGCETAEELKAVWEWAFKLMKSNQDGEAIAQLEPVKDHMKKLIQEANKKEKEFQKLESDLEDATRYDA